MTSSSFIKDNMLIDPSMAERDHQKSRGRECLETTLTRLFHFLFGTLKAPDGREVGVHLRHAADAVLLDDFGNVVLVTRKYNPGAGLKRCPAVFLILFREPGERPVAENADNCRAGVK